MFNILIWGAWSFVWRQSPPKPPGEGTDLMQSFAKQNLLE